MSLVAFMLLGSCYFTFGQAKLKAANKEYEQLSYATAIKLYEEVLTEPKLEAAAKKEALTKLAYSYRRVQDTKNAERAYADLLKEFPEVESVNYMYYAQALASNSKYKEAQKYYSIYGEKQMADMRSKRFAVSYMDMSRFYRDSAMYQVEYLPINSPQSDFSPMYYKGGLVFCSAREEGGAIKRVYGWNQTPFLNLYQVPDTASLWSSSFVQKAASLGGLAASNSDKTLNDPATKANKVAEFSRVINTKYHEGPLAFFKGEQRVIFTRSNYSSGKAREAKDGITKLKLYIADAQKDNWVNIKELPFNSDEYSNGHPALSPDNTRLYFVSDMPGGYGGTDIYVVEYTNGGWGSPVNLGKEINTEGNEMFPFVDENGNFYFASDGHEGLGGLDIFFAEMKEGIPYKGIENLGAPINSSKDDFSIITDGARNTGYFASNRKGGLNDDNIYGFRRVCRPLTLIVYDVTSKQPLENVDIRLAVNGENRELRVTNIEGATSICLESNSEYEFKAIKEGYLMNSVVYSTKSRTLQKTTLELFLEKAPVAILKGVVKSEASQQPIAGVEVTLENTKNKSMQKVVTGPDGGYEFQVQPGADHKLVAQKDKYAINEEQIANVKPNEVAITIENVQGMYGEGDIIKLNNIYYNFGKFFIRPDAAKEIERTLLPLLRKYPNMKIEIRSHTDSRSSDAFNMQLSANRARAVVDYLTQRGIDPSRLTSNGYGETDPVNECVDGVVCDEKQHQENRRTEFRIIAVK